ncbi:copper homeostasis protein CutC [Paenibacillus nanensis]|uniref:PF03932 family protein CutC n=1 Tax=Paenibacillus nanensis TaxID=393251 RepID=A0A3A1VK76_9BACL|nr:copper homeostasis protein CutC [Paenibacillus nanensis]RIX60026.1 copper homeostasis protein CutC [Paenibacillus nanensis]
MLIEVIAIRAEDAEAAYAGGADRIELVSGIAEGGLTPSIGLVEAVVKTAPLPVNVMVRPHSQSFWYSEADLSIMLRDIRAVREAGAAGIVVGVLDEYGGIDRAALERLLNAAEGLDVTFHRAFDEIADQVNALRQLAEYPQISRVLTAGGLQPAPQSADKIRQLRMAGDALGICILGGYGLHANNIAGFVRQTGVREVHFGGGVRQAGSFKEKVDPELIRGIRELLSRLQE